MLRSPVVVGRDGELEAIRRAFDDAGDGKGGCLFLLGEAGSGKTRLLREARQEARDRGMSLLTGSVPLTGASSAFGVLTQALRSWTRSNPVPAAELASFALGLHQVLPEWPLPPNPADLPHSQVRLLVVEGILRLLLIAARDQGAVVLLDDLHDADPETFEFLRHCTTSIGFEALLILGAVRTGEHRPGEAWARALVRSGQAAILEVDHLEESGVAALVQAALDAPPPRELVIDLLSRTDGVPLLVEEMLAAHLAAGNVRRDNGSVHWSPDGRSVVPGTIIELVRERLDRLTADDRAPLVAGSVLGRFDLTLLSAATGLDSPTLVARLQGALNEGLVDPDGPTVRFRHALLRDAVVENLPPLERVELHRRTAEALDALYSEDPDCLEERAQHREAIGDDDTAAQLFVQAARRNLTRHAPGSAEVLLRRALGLARSATTSDEVREALVEALGALGRWEEALSLDAELLASQGDRPGRLLRMAGNAVTSGRLDEADALIARAASTGVAPARLVVLSALVSLWRGDVERAAEGGREALAAAQPTGDVELICEALDVTGRAVSSQGQLAEAAAMFRQWAALAERAGLKRSRLQALVELGNVDMIAGGPPDGLQAARALAREAGAYSTLVLAGLSLEWWLYFRARFHEVAAIADEDVDLCRRLRLDLLPHALVGAAASRNALAWDSGEPLLAEALALAPGNDDVLICVEYFRGEMNLRAGRFERAEEHLARATALMFAVPSAVQVPAPFERIGALLALGRGKEATVALEEAKDQGIGKIYYLPVLLAAAEALVASSPLAFEEALAPAAENAPYCRALFLVLGAEVLRSASSAIWLRQALAVFEGAGAHDDATRVRRLLRDIGARAPRRSPAVARTAAEGPPEQRERRTFMFTDIVGSTNLVEMLGDEAWGHLLRWHDQVLRSLFAQHRGEEVKQIGDGFFVAFERPAPALECAVAIQRALARHRLRHGFAPQVRIGLHEADATKKGGDYEGKGVHEAARIGALAEGGKILSSRATVARIRRFPVSAPVSVSLKGISQPVEVVSIDWA